MRLPALPIHGAVYFDANAFIYFVEGIQPYYRLLEPVWNEARAGRFVIQSSQAVIVETLIKQIREGALEMQARFEEALDARHVDLLQADRNLWEVAANLGGVANLRSLDALHAATALRASSAMFITNDVDFRRVPGLPVVILRDYV